MKFDLHMHTTRHSPDSQMDPLALGVVVVVTVVFMVGAIVAYDPNYVVISAVNTMRAGDMLMTGVAFRETFGRLLSPLSLASLSAFCAEADAPPATIAAAARKNAARAHASRRRCHIAIGPSIARNCTQL